MYIERTVEQLKSELTDLSGIKLDIYLNQNRSTMLSILDQGEKWIRISMHKMFLHAPENVMKALATYMSKHTIAPSIKGYINDQLPLLDYSDRIDRTRLDTQGKTYDLQQFYDELNQHYFGNTLNLGITWFGKKRKRGYSQLILGQYQHLLKLIKINRLLDQKIFPDYYVKFIIYHEMLHFVFPPLLGSRGCQRDVHHVNFRAHEKAFIDYERAQAWGEKNAALLFRGIYA